MKMKKWITLFIGMIMITSILGGCGSKAPETETTEKKEADTNLTASGMPIVKEPITVKFFAPKRFASQNLNDIMLWNEYEKMTNINVEWNDVIREQLVEKKNIILASGDYPDVFYGSRFTSSDLQKYGQQGVFVKLNDLIENHAPNIKRILDQNPEIKKAMTMPDGNIYAIPTITDPSFTAMRSGTFMWYKQEWLDKLGVSMPKTTEELYNFLKQVKEKDPNAVPIGGSGIDTLISHIKGSWGLGNRGASHPNVDVDPKTGELRFIPVAPEYKEMLQYIQKLYSEGLLYKDTFSANTDQAIANGIEGKYVVHPGYNPEAMFKQKGYIGGLTLTGPHGDQLYANVGATVGSSGQFVITSNNKYPEATMRWVDYLYSDEGAKMFFMGFENVTYKKTADDQYEFVDEIKNNPKGLTQDQAVAQYLTWPGGGYPGILKQQFFKGSEGMPSSIEAVKIVESQFPEEVWAPFVYTQEETDKMSALKADIETYVTEMQAKFITGNVPFTQWDNYTATLQKMGLDEYMEIYKAAYERYKK